MGPFEFGLAAVATPAVALVPRSADRLLVPQRDYSILNRDITATNPKFLDSATDTRLRPSNVPSKSEKIDIRTAER